MVAAEVPLAKPAVSDDALGDRLAVLHRAPELLDHGGGSLGCGVVVGGRDREIVVSGVVCGGRGRG